MEVLQLQKDLFEETKRRKEAEKSLFENFLLKNQQSSSNGVH